MISITDGTTALELPGDLAWVDEYEWSPVASSAASYSLTGALLVVRATRQTGRPITLRGDANRAWITRAEVAQLTQWRDNASQTLTLTLRGETRAVAFRHFDEPTIEADPAVFFGDPISTDPYRATLKLMEV